MEHLTHICEMSLLRWQRRQEDSYASRHDALTGLLNRRGLEEDFQGASATVDPEGVLLVVLLDLDYFKETNDRFGHQVGDLALTATAKRLRGLLRSEDCIARWGGDEFVLLVPTGVEEVNRILTRLRSRPGWGLETEDQELLPITWQLGHAVVPARQLPAASLPDLIAIADEEMLARKGERPARSRT